MAPISLTFAETSDLEVRQLRITEALSAPFEVDAICVSKNAAFDLDAFVGHRVHLEVDRGALGKRGWGGICSGFDALPGDADGGLMTYAVRIIPELGLLEHQRGMRTFVERTAIEIAESFLGSRAGAPMHRLGREHPKHALRVQRGEIDLHFVERLLEDDGISYTFTSSEHLDQPSRVVLIDAPERVEPRFGVLPILDSVDPASATPFATDVHTKASIRSSAATALAFDFTRPRFQPSYHARGAARGEAGLDQVTFTKVAGGAREGDDRVADRLASGRFERETLTFTTNVVGLAPGDAIELARADGKARRLVVTRTAVAFREGASFESEITAVPAEITIRPERRAPRPEAPGLESAFVVGPEGAEIHADEHGRVQLRFAWDHNSGEKPFWARVDAAWAGAGHGAIALPRVGGEVLVSYLHGDGDDPVVIGRVFNAADPPPHPLPHGAAKTTWRSRTSPEGSAGHELTFDDKKGAELVRVRSERDLSKHVKHDQHAKVAHHASLVVGGSRSSSVGQTDVLDVGSLHEVRMAKVTASGGASGLAQDAAPLETRREIVARRITLTTGGATIVLDGPDIVVAGDKNVRIQAGGVVSIQGEPYVHLNPPGASAKTSGDKVTSADHVVWFRLVSDNRPLPGVRVHVAKDGADPGDAHTVETDGKGEVKIPQAQPGTFHAKVAHGSDHAPDGVPVATVTTQPTSHAKPTEHDVPIKIEIIEPKANTTFHLHTTARMPEIPLEARVVVGGKPVAIGHVGWNFRLEGQYRVRSESGSSYREQAYRLPAGHVMTAPGESKTFTLAPAQLLGGALELEVNFSGGEALGGIRASQKISGMKVLGRNAPRAEVEAYIAEKGGNLAWLYLRMFCHESLHRLVQFAEKSGGGNTPGEPLYGPPSGVGIVQRDPTAGEWDFPKSPVTHANSFFPRIFWDWKHNVDEGIHSFTSDYIERGRTDLNALRHEHPSLPMYPEGVLLRAAIRRYNGGIEFGASGSHYVVSPTYTNNPGYVNDVLNDPDIDAHKYPVPAAARATEWP